ncbi:MAG: hypothetical protein VKO39_02835 [Cyanobacteriota bacterium]|nr:hypothetical protein [Cyanobacteriota bacterium]
METLAPWPASGSLCCAMGLGFIKVLGSSKKRASSFLPSSPAVSSAWSSAPSKEPALRFSYIVANSNIAPLTKARPTSVSAPQRRCRAIADDSR